MVENSSVNSNNNILTIQTIQIAPFRTLMTALKDILLETNITFSPDGIRIINMDKSHTILAHLFLAAVNFEFYECKSEKIVIALDPKTNNFVTRVDALREMEDPGTIFFEKNWSPYLTEAIYGAGFKHS